MLLLIDNIDSFTYNLARYFIELGETVKVVRNDSVTLQDIERLNPAKLVFSPGPCTPAQAGITLTAIERFAGEIPILGVCLGHQAIGQVFGAKVCHASEIRHGKTSKLSHNGKELFHGLPEHFEVTRYHSLVLEDLPDVLSCDAWCDTIENTREIMGISHTILPVWGVQFHPESLLTEFGYDILSAFLKNASKA